MKKLLILLPLLLLLAGCGKNDVLYGKVSAVVPREDYVELHLLGKDPVVLADDTTQVYSFTEEIPHNKLLSGELTEPYITAYDVRRTKGGFLAERIYVESVLIPEAYTLTDGTKLNIRKGYHGTVYETADGWELLWEQEPVGPHNSGTIGLPAFEQLSQKTQDSIMKYYDDLGILYDLDAELEMAWTSFQSFEKKTDFQSYHLAQHITATAANEKLIWYSAIITEPLDSGLVREHRSGTIFDRETGAVVNTADLFNCPESEVAAVLLDLAGMPDTQLRTEMEHAFRFEYLNFHSDAMDIQFPAGSLPSHNTDYIIGLHYKDLSDILHPWAIPDSLDQ